MLQTGLSAFEIIKLYSGNATFMLMFVLSLVYLWVFEKDRIKKSVLVVLSVIMLVLFVFPLFSYIFMDKFGEEGTYYRFLWLVPTAIVSSYTILKILERFKNKFVKIGAFTFVVICIYIGGVNMYEAPVFYKAENAYELPQCVIDMCDDMMITEGREYEAVFPDAILQYPRLYTTFITMPYGFETLQFGKGAHSELHDEMVKDEIDVEYLCALCEGKHIHYIVLNQNKTLNGSFDNCNYEFAGSYGNYDMYKSTTLYFGAWEDLE